MRPPSRASYAMRAPDRLSKCPARFSHTSQAMAHEHDAVSADDLVLLVDSVQDYAMLVLSPTGEIQSWNLGAELMTGYTAEEAIGKPFSMLYLHADVAAGKPQHELETALAAGRTEDDGWRRRKNGT